MSFSLHLELTDRARRLAQQVLPAEPRLFLPVDAPMPTRRDQIVFGEPPTQLTLAVYQREFHCSEAGVRLVLQLALPSELGKPPPDLALL